MRNKLAMKDPVNADDSRGDELGGLSSVIDDGRRFVMLLVLSDSLLVCLVLSIDMFLKSAYLFLLLLLSR